MHVPLEVHVGSRTQERLLVGSRTQERSQTLHTHSCLTPNNTSLQRASHGLK